LPFAEYRNLVKTRPLMAISHRLSSRLSAAIPHPTNTPRTNPTRSNTTGWTCNQSLITPKGSCSMFYSPPLLQAFARNLIVLAPFLRNQTLDI
jgi:hypothetical protein